MTTGNRGEKIIKKNVFGYCISMMISFMPEGEGGAEILAVHWYLTENFFSTL